MGQNFRVWTIFLLVAFFGCRQAQAAKMEVLPDHIQGHAAITVVGEFELGDQDRFENLVFNLDKAIVFFDSPGGNVFAGIGIGKTIRLKKFVTAVANNSICASACALAWLGGDQRLILEPGKVGFHAAYQITNGTTQESGTANALVGAYLNQLGMTTAAIGFLTEKPPEQINWLNKDLAAILGIQAVFIPPASEIGAVGDLSPSQAAPISNPPAPEVQPTIVEKPVEAPRPPTQVQISDSDLASKKEFVLLADRDVYGFDLGKPTSAESIGDCQRQCEGNFQCVAFTFSDELSRCYLKSDASRVWWSHGLLSGFRKDLQAKISFYSLALRPSSTLAGEEYSFYLNSKTEECADLCSGQRDCTGFTFTRKKEGRCSLRKGNLRFLSSQGSISGVKTAQDSAPRN